MNDIQNSPSSHRLALRFILLHLSYCSAKKIVMAVKAGGGPDPEKNRQLAQVIADAKVNNVPRDVIERQLSKANAAATIGSYSLSERMDCFFFYLKYCYLS